MFEHMYFRSCYQLMPVTVRLCSRGHPLRTLSAGGNHTVHTIHCTHVPTSRTAPCSARKWSRMGPLVLFCVLNVLCVCIIYTEAQARACTYWEHRQSLAACWTWVMKLQQPCLSRAAEPSPIPLPKSTKSKLLPENNQPWLLL